MTEYAAYYDVAGHSSDQPFVIVAGFISSERRWRIFEKKWVSALGKYGLGKSFHATDFENNQDGLRGWAERISIRNHLVDIATNHTSCSIAIAIDMAAYKKLTNEYALEEYIGTPHAIAARTFSRYVSEWKRKNCKPDDKLLIFHESGGEHIGDMQLAFERDGLPQPSPVPKDFPPVQPADLLGWLFSVFLRAKQISESLFIIRRRNSAIAAIYVEKDMRRLCENQNVPRRDVMPPDAVVKYHSRPKQPRRRTIR